MCEAVIFNHLDFFFLINMTWAIDKLYLRHPVGQKMCSSFFWLGDYTEDILAYSISWVLFKVCPCWLSKLNIKHRKLYLWPERPELCDKQALNIVTIVSMTNFSIFPLVFATASKEKGHTVTGSPLSTQALNELTCLIVRPSSCAVCLLIFSFDPRKTLLSCIVLSFTCLVCLVLLLPLFWDWSLNYSFSHFSAWTIVSVCVYINQNPKYPSFFVSLASCLSERALTNDEENYILWILVDIWLLGYRKYKSWANMNTMRLQESRAGERLSITEQSEATILLC